MLKVLRQEKKLYFGSTKRFVHCFLTHESEYLIWKFVKLLRKEEHSKGIFKYLYARKKII